MNNIKYKNVELGEHYHNSLPYPDVNQIKYGNGTTVTAVRMNNTFRQLQYNDRFIERQLLSPSSAGNGPKSNDVEVYRAPNGYKVWDIDDNGSPRILKKVETPIQQSIVSTSVNASSNKILYINGIYVASTDKGVMFSLDGKEYSMMNGGPLNKRSVDMCSDNGITFVLYDDSVYQIFYEENDTRRPYLTRRNSTALEGICSSMFYDYNTCRMYIGTEERGVMYCEGVVSEQKQNLTMTYVTAYDGRTSSDTIHVNDIIKVEAVNGVKQNVNDILLASNDGIYQQNIDFGVTNPSRFCIGDDVTETVYANGRLMFMTLNGLKDSDGNIIGDIHEPLYSSLVYDDMVIFGSHNEIIRYDFSSGDAAYIPLSDGSSDENVVRLCLTRPRGTDTEDVVPLMILLTSEGNVYSFDTQINYIRKIADGVHTMFATQSNTMYFVKKDDKKTITTYDVSRFFDMNSDIIKSLEPYGYTHEGIVDYILPDNESRNIDKGIVISQNEMVDLLNNNNIQLKNITASKIIHDIDNNTVYGLISDGSLVIVDGEMNTMRTIDGVHDFCETQNTILMMREDGLYTIPRDNIEYGDMMFQFGIQHTESTRLDNDEDVTVMLNNGTLYGIHENDHMGLFDGFEVSNVNDIRTQQITADDDTLSVVYVATSDAVHAYQLSVVEVEDTEDDDKELSNIFIHSEPYQGTIYRLHDGNYENSIKMFTDDGIRQLSAYHNTDGTVGYVQIDDVLSAGHRIHDMVTVTPTMTTGDDTVDDIEIDMFLTENGLDTYKYRITYVDNEKQRTLVEHGIIGSGMEFTSVSFAMIENGDIGIHVVHNEKLYHVTLSYDTDISSITIGNPLRDDCRLVFNGDTEGFVTTGNILYRNIENTVDNEDFSYISNIRYVGRTDDILSYIM